MWVRLPNAAATIAKFHVADLNFKYSIQGLDLTEMRAVWACVPDEFENDGTGRSRNGSECIATRLTTLIGPMFQPPST